MFTVSLTAALSSKPGTGPKLKSIQTQSEENTDGKTWRRRPSERRPECKAAHLYKTGRFDVQGSSAYERSVSVLCTDY